MDTRDSKTIVTKLTRLAESLRETPWFRRIEPFLPWCSLAWGAASSVLISRDYAHSSRLLVYFLGLVLVSILLSVGLVWLERHKDEFAVRSLFGRMAKRPDLWHTLGLYANQACSQYVLLFCIPLLYLAHSWITLGVSVVALATTLWDDWWLKLARRIWYIRLMRCLCAILAMSFALSVAFPRALPHFYPILGVTALVSIFPWDWVVFKRPPVKEALWVFLGAAVFVGSQACLDSWLRVPVLSVWLKRPQLGLDVKDSKAVQAFPRSISDLDLAQALSQGHEVCCVTPVVSPSGTDASVRHEWFINGRLSDKVTLKRVRESSTGESRAYHTYSCKKNFGDLALIRDIRCDVYLDDDIYIGRVGVHISQTKPRN